MSDTLKIGRVDLAKDGKSVSIKFEQMVSDGDLPFKKRGNDVFEKEPTEDLTNIFIKLIPHVLWIPQLYPTKADVDKDWFDNFTFLDNPEFPEFAGINITAVVISGKDEEMVQLIGTKTNDRKEVMPLTPAKIWLDDASEKAYFHSSIVKATIEELKKEVEAFHKGKFVPAAQQSLL